MVIDRAHGEQGIQFPSRIIEKIAPPHRPKTVLQRLYPERRFSQIVRDEGRFLFYSIVADLTQRTSTVLDFGAGRGHEIEVSRGHLRSLLDFRGRCAKVIGVDPDPAVLNNPFLDEKYVLNGDGTTPLPAASVDIVAAFAVLEHVSNPRQTADEVYRILKPGGWMCAWTPNKWGYVGTGVRLIPNALHSKLVPAAEPRGTRGDKDVFPTAYQLNTLGDIGRYFDAERFNNYSFTANGSPSYHFGSVFIARFWKCIMWLSPPPFRKTLFVFVQKR